MTKGRLWPVAKSISGCTGVFGNLRPNFRYGLQHLVYKVGLIHNVFAPLADLNREVHVSNDQWADGTTTNQEIELL